MAQIDENKEVTPEQATPPVVEDKKPDNKAAQDEITKLKAALSKANSEAADWKRQYQSTLTEQQRAEAERAEREKAREARIAELEAKERISTYTKKLMEAGIDPNTADLMANSLPDGVADTYFEAVKAYNTNQKRILDNEDLNKQPPLSVGTPPTGANAKSDEDKKYDRWWGLA